MNMRAFQAGLAAILLLATPISSTAMQPDPAAAPDVQGAIDEALSFLLMDAMHARATLREHGESQRADGFWNSVTRFAAAIRDADPDDQHLFLPIIAGFRTAVADRITGPDGLDRDGVTAIQTSLDDQIRIQTAPGGSSGSKGGIRVLVRALSGTQSVGGLYVWLDLSGSVPRGMRTALSVPGATPAQTTVGPGEYLVRLVKDTPRGQRIVGSRVTNIGNQLQERVDVQVSQP